MQQSREDIVKSLAEFAVAPKFRCTEPEFRLLNPSSASITIPMEKAINGCASQLVSLVNAGAPPSQVKACIANSLRAIEKPFDTEDREYFAYYFNQLGHIVGVNVSPILNQWLYGLPLSLAMRLFGRG